MQPQTQSDDKWRVLDQIQVHVKIDSLDSHVECRPYLPQGDQLKSSPLVQQKSEELLAVLAADGFGADGRPLRETTLPRLKSIGPQSGRYLAPALDEPYLPRDK